jgi:mannosyl-oligosaccharide alpha-1,2-mannosidase
MGMKDEFKEARDWVASRLTFDHAGVVSMFETTIRELGGLLSAYDLSKDSVFLEKANELSGYLLPAFDTSSGIPTSQVNMRSHQGAGGWSGGSAILAELGTLQVEFRYLAHHAKKPAAEKKAMKPLQLMHQKNPPHGLYPIMINTNDGSFADRKVTFGALGDSFYEYLLKVWIQGGKKEMWLREMYDRAMDGVMDVLLQASSPSGLAFLSDWNGFSNTRKMDHLVCFMPGALALGAHTDPKGSDSPRAKRDLAVAKALMYTCREMYHRMNSGIAPEYVEFPEGRDLVAAAGAPFYILRPETAESLFILNQLTGDPIYRDWAWEIWEAIEKNCRTEIAYGALRDVNNPRAGVDDRMESFFLAETMKYLYLAQDPDNSIDLDEYVFNTEAHPLTILDDSHVPVPAS